MLLYILDYTDYIILPDALPSAESAPPLILTSFSPNVSVSVGERAVLSCRVAHTARNTISWIRHSPSGKHSPPHSHFNKLAPTPPHSPFTFYPAPTLMTLSL